MTRLIVFHHSAIQAEGTLWLGISSEGTLCSGIEKSEVWSEFCQMSYPYANITNFIWLDFLRKVWAGDVPSLE